MSFDCKLETLQGRIFYCDDWSWRAPVFRDRWHAGEVLAGLVSMLVERGVWEKPSWVYAIPAGGVPVGLQVAKVLGARFDLIVVKKVTYPWTTEAGFGAVAPDGRPIVDASAASELGDEVVARQAEAAWEKVRERLEKLRGTTRYPRLEGETVLVVDDGIAAGWTMIAAVRFLRNLAATRIYVAAPTGSLDGTSRVAEHADSVAVVNLRGGLYFAVADAYLEWRDLEDEEVVEILRREGWSPPL
ncbi:phosphoribosyltransferase [Pyrolobus fumarii 1A]|uniref:Phosphoribosyltransferase n=1 Tax=Pyrolobus fumarii (strain DSM 11204 / 1A) TaxID=694429 RepID=G0ED89_PYRF1|nr:phosphoribosyltransferase family protein [Pyrolobus fumarii]AEM39767.1 phosphoribosyltransferase [Pyrolobus fumarii 1A]